MAPHRTTSLDTPGDTGLPRGQIGEVVVRGDNVMVGYWNKPEQTAAALRGGWMHTGDVGYFDDRGYLFIVNRVKDMIITGGENVYSAEVENALAGHPAVAGCPVIGVPDPTWGERVHAVVVLQPGREATASSYGSSAAARSPVTSCPQRRLRRCAAGLRRRQGPQTRTAQAALGHCRPQRQLTPDRQGSSSMLITQPTPIDLHGRSSRPDLGHVSP